MSTFDKGDKGEELVVEYIKKIFPNAESVVINKGAPDQRRSRDVTVIMKDRSKIHISVKWAAIIKGVKNKEGQTLGYKHLPVRLGHINFNPIGPDNSKSIHSDLVDIMNLTMDYIIVVEEIEKIVRFHVYATKEIKSFIYNFKYSLGYPDVEILEIVNKDRDYYETMSIEESGWLYRPQEYTLKGKCNTVTKYGDECNVTIGVRKNEGDTKKYGDWAVFLMLPLDGRASLYRNELKRVDVIYDNHTYTRSRI